MKSFKKAFKEADEYYTPSILVECLKDSLMAWCKKQGKKPSETTVWCPFDEPHSKYVTIIRSWGFKVESSHINEGKNFFDYEPDDWDISISNPPFSIKMDVFRHLYGFQKPFVMLMNIMALNYQEIGNLFWQIGPDLQFLIPDKKVSFNGKTSSFCSGYVCYKFLDRTEFVHLENNNSGVYFRE